MKKLLLFIIVLFCNVSYAQQGVPFKENKHFYIKGTSELIGNNIISTHKNKPLHTNNTTNDLLKLKYIDVDNNKKTFSSSSANLNLHSSDKTIKYAALYWSAVYKYNKGSKQIEEDRFYVYKGNNKRDSSINEILFKTPNDSVYQSLKGQVVYNSFLTEEFNNTKPYVCFADVTHLLKEQKNTNGTYTVGNIKATQGYIAGGCAGGWLLYVVYESEKETPKYFTSYNGFKSVDKETLDITFKDFKTAETGDIKASLLLGVLEGDNKIKTDMCLVYNTTSKTYVPLSNKLRPTKNFFNEKITKYNALYVDRNPNSTRTLGFDVLKINIPNQNNTIILNNQTETSIRLTTKADGFNLFFVAFETEINPSLLKQKTNTDTVLIEKNTTTTLKNNVDYSGITNTNTIENIVVKKNLEEKNTIKTQKSKTENSALQKIKTVTIPGLEKGYYLITNVFSIKENASKWIAFLKKKNYNARSYINPKNGWTYIYVEKNEDPNITIQTMKRLSKLKDFKGLWVLKIN